ncbi:MAG: hypothetical protein WCG26_10450 [Chloroflexales bacterium]
MALTKAQRDEWNNRVRDETEKRLAMIPQAEQTLKRTQEVVKQVERSIPKPGANPTKPASRKK